MKIRYYVMGGGFDMGTQPGEIVLQYDAHGSEDASHRFMA